MSKHWNPRTIAGGRASRPRRRRGYRPSETGLMLLTGLFLGLVAVQIDEGRWSWPGDASASGGAAEIEPARPTRRVERSDAVEVVDGDTFRLGSEKIRIADIDAPELDASCAAEAELADAATRRLAVLLGQGPFELERIGRDEDRYGRKLRIVTRDGRSIGDQLVAEGLARTWSGKREPWCA